MRIQGMLLASAIALSTTTLSMAFQLSSPAMQLQRRLVNPVAENAKTTSLRQSTYDYDSDEEAEQNLGTGIATIVENANGSEPNGSSTSTVNGSSSNKRFDALLQSVGLDGKIKFIEELPDKREVSATDVFCNRELKMGNLAAIGFDMDYTLAQYQQPAFDRLAFDGAKRKLVETFGYPEEVLDFEYDHTDHWIRGLIIDTERGNFLKIDRHKYVRVAYHGFEKISSTTRKHLYSRTFNKVPSFSEKSYVNMDTLFQFVDAHLFALLIDLKDNGEYESLDFKTYDEIYRQIRECVDLCHRDGVIKDVVAQEPDKYLVHDENLLGMLRKFRNDGVKLFLLTNSYWEYTSTAMNYLYHGKLVDDETQKKNEWLELFDLAIVGSCKPAYMLDPYLNLFRVNPQDGSLLNTDGVFEIKALGENGAEKFLRKGKTFQGGNWLHLHSLLNIEAGEEILYVGDHLYADVLRSKRTLGWRSMFIVPELEEEIRVFNEQKPIFQQITELRQLRDELSHLADEIISDEDDDSTKEEKLAQFSKEDSLIKDKLSTLAAQWHASFHPIWGAMFNAGYQDSRFAFYVQNYACLYSSRATNLGFTSSSRNFRTGLEMLPHDRIVVGDKTQFEQ